MSYREYMYRRVRPQLKYSVHLEDQALADGGGRHYRRRDCRVEHCISPDLGRLPQRSSVRAGVRTRQRIDRQEHGRRTCPVFYACQHSDVVVFDSFLCQLRRTAWLSLGLPSTGVSFLRDERKTHGISVRELRKASCHGLEGCAADRWLRDPPEVPTTTGGERG